MELTQKGRLLSSVEFQKLFQESVKEFTTFYSGSNVGGEIHSFCGLRIRLWQLQEPLSTTRNRHWALIKTTGPLSVGLNEPPRSSDAVGTQDFGIY